MIVPGPAGVYLVGTGRTGVMATFLVLGAGYLVVMLVAAFSYRLPAPGWKPAGWTPPVEDGAQGRMITTRNVGVDDALRTPQFYLLWIVLCFNVSAGIGVLGVAKTMMTDIFGAMLPKIVDGRFAATFVLMTSVFNMLGRFFWASASDYLGRKFTYTLFFVFGAALYLAIPLCAWQASVSQPVLWLVIFYAVAMLIFTMYGGGFAAIGGNRHILVGNEHLEIVAKGYDFFPCPWNETPVIGPCIVEDGDDDVEIAGQVFLVEWPDGDLAGRQRAVTGGADDARELGLVVVVIGDHVLRLGEAVLLDAGGVIGEAMAHHHVGRRIEAIDEEAHLVVDRKAEGPLDAGHATRFQPLAGGVKQGGKHRRLVGRFEKAKLAGPVPMTFKTQMVDLGGDAAHRLAVTLGQEKLHLGVLEIRVFFGIEVFEALKIERRHPVGVISIDVEGHIEKGALVVLGGDGPDGDWICHGGGHNKLGVGAARP